MRMLKRRIALLLAMGLVLGSIPFTGKEVKAEPLPGFTDDKDIAEDADITDEGGSPDYVEGDVIVCMREGALSYSYGNGEASPDKADEITLLLDGAEDLMDVTQAVEESGLAGDEEGTGPVSGETPDKAIPDEYLIRCIHSDRYTTQELISMLEGRPDVIFAEPNYISQLTEEDIADPFEGYDMADILPVRSAEEGETGPYDLTGSQYAYGDGRGGMDVPSWNSPGYLNAEGTVVAVLDTGVDYEHEDLKDVMWDDGLMYPELTELGGGRYGYNAVEKDSKGNAYNSYDPMDDNAHGTHCAGIIGAAWNGYGVSGTANGTKIMAIKHGADTGINYLVDTIRGFNYIKAARKAGVNVVAVNNSWGGPGESNSIRLAAAELTQLGVVSCYASGNAQHDNDHTVDLATTFIEEEGVICVNSNDKAGLKSGFSNYGIRSTDVSAPGTAIMSTIPMGTGEAGPNLCTPDKDALGREARDLFEDENTYFTYKAEDGIPCSYTEDEGKRVLKMSNLPEQGAILTVSSNTALDTRPGYLAVNCRVDTPGSMALLVGVLLEGGEFKTVLPASNEYNRAYYKDQTYELPEDMDLKNPTFKFLSVLNPELTVTAEESFYISGISLTSERSSYELMNGTSMATPAVAGEVAVLASRWPDDDADKRAARVIGSTRYVSDLEGTSRTGGIANVRKALNCDYSPVVNKARLLEDGQISISGYFFGHDAGNVTILAGGQPVSAEVTEWKGLDRDEWDDKGKNDRDTIVVRTGTEMLPEEELTITVTSSDDKRGSRMLILHSPDGKGGNPSLYKPLPLPEDEEACRSFGDTYFLNGVGLDGKIFYSGAEPCERGEIPVLWSYDTTGENTSSRWVLNDKAIYAFTRSNMCAWNRMIVYLDENDLRIKTYSPGENMVYDTGITIRALKEQGFSSAYLVNAENELYLFTTFTEEKVIDGERKQVGVRTDLYRIDMDKKKAVLLGTLDSVQEDPVLKAVKDGSGRVMINSLAAKDDTSLAWENITIEGDNISSVSGVTPLPEDCSFDGNHLKGSVTQYGFVLTGPSRRGNNADTFLYSPDDGSVRVCDKQISSGCIGCAMATGYGGKTYFLCIDPSSEQGNTFACADNDEFRGSGSTREALHDYGDDDLGNIGSPEGVISLTPENEGNLPVGRRIKITPEFTVRNDKPVDYTWYSENALIASVDGKGYVTGISKGLTDIYAIGRDAAGNEYKGKCTVRVYPMTTAIKLSEQKLNIAAGSDFELSAYLTPVGAETGTVKWSVSAPGSYPGAVEKKREGIDGNRAYAVFRTKKGNEKIQVKITASAQDGSNRSASCTVTIGKPVSAVTLKDETINLIEGRALVLRPDVSPKDALNKTLKWTSDNTDVATVTGTGQVKAVGSGTCTIKAEATDGSGISASCTVNVNAPVKSAILSETGIIYLGAGMEHEINLVRILPQKPGDYRVEWKSSDPSSVTVSGDKLDKNRAVIKAVKKGTARISAVITNADPGGRKTVNTGIITVMSLQSDLSGNSVRIFNNRTDITGKTGLDNRLAVGRRQALKASAYFDDNVLNPARVKVIWTSSDPSVASVNNGVITSYKEGPVTISARLVPKYASGPLVSATCAFYIYNPIKKLTLDRYDGKDESAQDGDVTPELNTKDVKNIKMSTDERLYLKAAAETAPTGPYDKVREAKDYVWTSSDPGVVEAVDSGSSDVYLKPKAAGTAVITCKAKDGSNRQARCTVTVVERVRGIKITAKGLLKATVNTYDSQEITVRGLENKKGFTIAASIEPVAASNKTVTYRSNNPSAVTVNERGYVKRCGAGNADIIVTTVDGGYRAVCHVIE
ncbi:MAG: Ig-like domain-containing protein [Lachnospiraceae bacterium]|nr:Ig-like domain-containing protein [Lachnospiraceae bacterium]